MTTDPTPSAPERVWIDHHWRTAMDRKPEHDWEHNGYDEYVRADLVQGLVEAAERADDGRVSSRQELRAALARLQDTTP